MAKRTPKNLRNELFTKLVNILVCFLFLLSLRGFKLFCFPTPSIDRKKLRKIFFLSMSKHTLAEITNETIRDPASEKIFFVRQS